MIEKYKYDKKYNNRQLRGFETTLMSIGVFFIDDFIKGDNFKVKSD